MKKITTCLFIAAMFITTIHAQTPTWLWAKNLASGTLNGSNGSADRFECIDPQGNIYVAGGYNGKAYLDADSSYAPKAGQFGMYVAKFSNSGNLLWKKSGYFSKSGWPLLSGIRVDTKDNLYVGLVYGDTLGYDGQTFVENVADNNTEYAVLCLKASDGAYQSKKMISAVSASYKVALDVNRQDELVTMFIQTVSNQDTLVLRKYSSTGTTTLDQHWGVGSFTGIYFTAFNASGNNIYLSGSNNNAFTIGSTTFPMPQANYWAVRFDNTGAVTWSSQGKSAGSVKSSVMSFAEDANGNFYTTGVFSGTYTLAGTTQTLVADSKSSGDADELFYSKYNASGSLLWLKQSHGLNSEAGHVIRVGTDGKLYMLGKLGGKKLYLGGDSTEATPVNSSNPFFIAQLDSSGKTLWLKRLNDVGNLSGAMGLYLDANNGIYISGSYHSLTSLALGTFTLPNVAGNKFFFAKTSVVTLPNGLAQVAREPATIHLFPNPASGTVNISLADKSKENLIEILSVNGQVLITQRFEPTDVVEINIHSLPTGVYFVRAGSAIKKLIVQ